MRMDLEGVSIKRVVELAEQWQSERKEWHFHMLTPDCVFNERNDKYAFVLENRSDQDTYVAYSDFGYMEEGKRLSQLMYGEEFVRESREPENPGNSSVGRILAKTKELTEKGIPWHHHMLFPDCIFNKHKGKWNIVFEDHDSEDVLESVTDTEPIPDLRAIEALYFAQER